MRCDLGALLVLAPLPAGVAIVPFSAEIALACRTLMNDVYTEGFGDIVDFDTWWTALQADAEYDTNLCLVAVAGNEVIGFCQCWTEPFIKDIVVAPRHRRRGLGTALLSRALAAFAARGSAHIELKTDADNLRAHSVYRRLGFEIVEWVG